MGMAPRHALLLVLSLSGAFGCQGRRTPEPAVAAPGPAERGSIRVVTFNVWGVPFRDRHDALWGEVAPTLAALQPDVVLLQEVWFENDARRVAAALAEVGLVHEVHHASSAALAFDSAGLMIASRWPIHAERFRAFSAGRLPVRPWHVDWFSGKGVQSARIEHPTGSLRVGTVHLQADYDGVVYTDVRVAQTAELVAALRPHPVHLLAGDFNSPEQALEHRVVRDALDMRSAVAARVDDILVVDSVEVSGTWALPAPAVVLDGETFALSDHPILVADVMPGPLAPPAATLEPALRKDLEDWWADRAAARWWKRGGGWLALFLGFFLVGASASRRRRGGGRLVRMALLTLALLAAVGAYRGIAVGHARDRWRDQARRTLVSHSTSSSASAFT